MNENLQRLIREFILQEEIRLSTDSIDDQIDSILLRFESDCIVPMGSQEIDASKETDTLGNTVEQQESRRYSLKRLIEADDDDEEEEEPDPRDSADAESKGGPADLTADQDDAKPDFESDPLKPKIDIHKFAGKVARLASNFESLLDLPIAIANRAWAYLYSNYDKSVAEEYSDILEREFNIELEHPSGEEPREKPMAIGAAASGLASG